MAEWNEDDKGIKITGPTGPNGTWQAGDTLMHAVGPFGHLHTLDEAGAKQLNDRKVQYETSAKVGEESRMVFTEMRICPKCGFDRKSPKVLHRGENDDCAELHGKSEHLDQECRRCRYIWACHTIDNIPLSQLL